MGTTLETPWNFRERIIGMGEGGSGKTAAYLSIARAIPTTQFFAIDNDVSYSYERLLETHFADVTKHGNIEVSTVTDDWDDIIDTMRGIIMPVAKSGERDCWLGLDSITPTWQSAQDYFTNKIFDMELADYFIRQRLAFETEPKAKNKQGKEIDEVKGFDGWKDWSVINKIYTEIYKLLKKWPGHFYLTAEQAKLSSQDDSEVKEDFGGYGVKPKGQKRLPYVSSTVVWFTKNGADSYYFTTMKDRGRDLVEGEEFDDFAMDYLVGVAGWKVKKTS